MSTRILDLVRAGLSLLLSGVFAVTITAAFVSSAALQTLYEPATTESLTQETRAAELGRGILARYFVSRAAGGGSSFELAARYPPETWAELAREIIPLDWGREALVETTGTLQGWLRGQDPSPPDLVIDITAIRESLRGGNGTRAFLSLLQSAPPCGENVEGVYLFADGELINCLPPDRDLTELSSTMAEQVADSLPATFSPLEPVNSADEDLGLTSAFRKIHTAVKALEAGRDLLWPASLLLLTLVGVLHASDLRQLALGLRLPMVLGGALSSVVALAVLVGPQLVRPLAFTALAPAIPGDAQALGLEIIQTIGRTLGLRALKLSLVPLALGLSLHAWFPATRLLRERFRRPDEGGSPSRARIRREFR